MKRLSFSALQAPRVTIPAVSIARKFLFCILLCALCSAVKYPRPAGYVSDFANVLDPSTRQALEAQLSDYERTSTNEIAVVTIPSLDGESIEFFAARLFKEWGVGKNGKDNGVLILVAPNDRQARIEVGYGLEGQLTDGLSGQIIREDMAPYFARGEYGKGIHASVDKIIRVQRDPDAAPLVGYRSGFRGILPQVFPIAVLFLAMAPFTTVALVLALLAIYAINTKMSLASLLFIIPGLALDWRFRDRLRQHWSSGGGRGGFGGGGGVGGGFGGGGFGGFGGGSSGGGGASGRW